jgi:hypothetical protein
MASTTSVPTTDVDTPNPVVRQSQSTTNVPINTNLFRDQVTVRPEEEVLNQIKRSGKFSGSAKDAKDREGKRKKRRRDNGKWNLSGNES